MVGVEPEHLGHYPMLRDGDDSFNIHNADAASVQNCSSRSRDLDRSEFLAKTPLKSTEITVHGLFTVLIPRPRRIEASSALPPRKSARSIPRIVKELPIDAWPNLMLLANKSHLNDRIRNIYTIAFL
jgi:hypothetical protein